MAEGAGRPTDLTDEIQSKIKENILAGFNLRETATNTFKELDNFKNISEEKREEELANFIQKLYNWNYLNYLKISEKIENWRRDRKVLLATKNLEDYLEMSTMNVVKIGDKEEIRRDSQLERIKADMTKFTLETLDKDVYSKRSELTGKDGEALIPNSEQREKSNKAINDILNDNTRNIEQQ